MAQRRRQLDVIRKMNFPSIVLVTLAYWHGQQQLATWSRWPGEQLEVLQLPNLTNLYANASSGSRRYHPQLYENTPTRDQGGTTRIMEGYQGKKSKARAVRNVVDRQESKTRQCFTWQSWSDLGKLAVLNKGSLLALSRVGHLLTCIRFTGECAKLYPPPRIEIFLAGLPSRGVHFKGYSLKWSKNWLKRLYVNLYFPSCTMVKFQILFQ